MSNKPSKPRRWFKNAFWNECTLSFLAACTSDRTRSNYAATLRRLFNNPARTPEKYTRAEIEAWLHAPALCGTRPGQPMTARTQNTYLMTLKSFYSYASHYIVIYRGAHVPLLRQPPPTTGIRRAKMGHADRDFEEDDIGRFLAVIDRETLLGKRDYALFLAYLCTGKRRVEIGRLYRRNFERVFLVENGIRREGWIFSFKPKGRITNERAEMPEECMQAIRAFHGAAGRDFETMPPEQPIFPPTTGSTKTHQPVNENQIDRRFRAYARAAGIAENVVVHSIRGEHAFIRFEENGHNILDVRDALNHKDVHITMQYIEKRKRRKTGDPVASRIAARYAQKS